MSGTDLGWSQPRAKQNGGTFSAISGGVNQGPNLTVDMPGPITAIIASITPIATSVTPFRTKGRVLIFKENVLTGTFSEIHRFEQLFTSYEPSVGVVFVLPLSLQFLPPLKLVDPEFTAVERSRKFPQLRFRIDAIPDIDIAAHANANISVFAH